jgi:hypothetical protein
MGKLKLARVLKVAVIGELFVKNMATFREGEKAWQVQPSVA